MNFLSMKSKRIMRFKPSKSVRIGIWDDSNLSQATEDGAER
jgi:hypothetical protein